MGSATSEVARPTSGTIAGVVTTLRREGTRSALRRIQGGVKVRLEPTLRHFQEWQTDRRYDIDSRGIDHGYKSLDKGHSGYEAVLRSEFDRAMIKLDIDRSEYTLVDFGCGKGAALVFSDEAGFGRTVGIEIGPSYVETARANLERVERRRPGIKERVAIVLSDATTAPIPSGPCVLFFNNPFGAEVMKSIMEKAVTSLEQSPRPCYLVYIHARQASVIEETERFRRIGEIPDGVLYEWRALPDNQ